MTIKWQDLKGLDGRSYVTAGIVSVINIKRQRCITGSGLHVHRPTCPKNVIVIKTSKFVPSLGIG